MSTLSSTLMDNGLKLFTEEEFLGVFASDTLPKTVGPLFNYSSLIVNTDTSNLPGTHWVGIISREDEAYYFDPFGYAPPLNIAKWLNKHYSNWTHNERQVQPITSKACGYFCLHFLYVSQQSYFNNIALHLIINHVYPKSLNFNQYELIVNNFVSNQKLE